MLLPAHPRLSSGSGTFPCLGAVVPPGLPPPPGVILPPGAALRCAQEGRRSRPLRLLLGGESRPGQRCCVAEVGELDTLLLTLVAAGRHAGDPDASCQGPSLGRCAPKTPLPFQLVGVGFLSLAPKEP